MLKKFFRSRKWVVALLAAAIRMFGDRVGLEPGAAEGASHCLLAAVGAEGLTDAFGALGRRSGDSTKGASP